MLTHVINSIHALKVSASQKICWLTDEERVHVLPSTIRPLTINFLSPLLHQTMSLSVKLLENSKPKNKE